MEAAAGSLVESLAQLTLFADLSPSQLEEVGHTFNEDVFGEGQRVIRQGMAGGGFCVILDGEATVVIEGEIRSRLKRGDFFGEISLLTGDPPTADVVAASVLRCLVIPGPALKGFLLEHPPVMLRMLQAEARRLRDANVWRG